MKKVSLVFVCVMTVSSFVSAQKSNSYTNEQGERFNHHFPVSEKLPAEPFYLIKSPLTGTVSIIGDAQRQLNENLDYSPEIQAYEVLIATLKITELSDTAKIAAIQKRYKYFRVGKKVYNMYGALLEDSVPIFAKMEDAVVEPIKAKMAPFPSKN